MLSPDLRLDVLPESKAQLKDALYKDFWLSFKFSQGDSKFQQDIYAYLAAYYGQTLTPLGRSALSELLPEFDKQTPVSFTGVSMPMGHKRLTNIEDGMERATFYAGLSSFTLKLGHISLALEEDNYPGIFVRKTIGKDARYQADLRTSGGDRHASFLRRYVLLGDDAGSPAFNYLCALAKEALPVELEANYLGIQATFNSLVTDWEANHPGQQFMPAEVE